MPEPAMTITLLTRRSMDNVISISYDRDIEGEDERAEACFDELLQALVQAGFDFEEADALAIAICHANHRTSPQARAMPVAREAGA